MSDKRKSMILFAGCIIICGVICNIKSSGSVCKKLPNLMLQNIEALSENEILNGSQYKEEYTWQDGPFQNGDREYFLVYTQTDCYGIGTIECHFNLSATIEYVK